MAEQEPSRGNWLWERLRKKTRKELDVIERDLVKGSFERREYAGDPNQPAAVRIRLRKK